MYSVIFLALAAIRSTYAWGYLGHDAVAYIAQNLISEDTRDWAQNILNDDSDDYLANASSFADWWKKKPDGYFSGPFHYINFDDDVKDAPVTCGLDLPNACGKDGCIVSAIANYTERVRNRGFVPLPAEEVNIALKLLIHFFGDITQPLHTEKYGRGGNELDVYWKGDISDGGLHSVWDSKIPEELRGKASFENAKAWANDLTREIEDGIYNVVKESWMFGVDVNDADGSAINMANDTNHLICTVVMPNGAEALENQELFPEYYNRTIDTVELQIAKGGYRLAHWLDALAPGGEDEERPRKLVAQPHLGLRKRI